MDKQISEKTDAELNLLLGLARRKKELLESIYDITSRHKFLGEETEIDDFVEYLNIREPYYEQLSKLNDEAGEAFKSFKVDFDSKNDKYREVSQLLSNINDIGSQIVGLDRENNGNMKVLHNRLMHEVKKISVSKKARNSYNYFQAQSDMDKQ